nr:hypothetical protein CFP56_58639 [Quercus suber]
MHESIWLVKMDFSLYLHYDSLRSDAETDDCKSSKRHSFCVSVTEVEISRIPHTQRGCQFKEQLKEIDVALCGDTADTTNHDLAEQSTGMSKAIQTKVHSTHAQVKEEGSDSHNGTQGEQNNNTMTLFGPQALNGPATQAQVNLPPLSSFIMGLTSSSCSAKPKLKKCNQATLKKGRVGPTMQRKENNLRRGINMENCSGLGTGTMMDVEQTKKSGKHRARSPLKNLSGNMENVKRNKLEGDVMALSKLMAQELGSVVAAVSCSLRNPTPFGRSSGGQNYFNLKPCGSEMRRVMRWFQKHALGVKIGALNGQLLVA